MENLATSPRKDGANGSSRGEQTPAEQPPQKKEQKRVGRFTITKAAKGEGQRRNEQEEKKKDIRREENKKREEEKAKNASTKEHSNKDLSTAADAAHPRDDDDSEESRSKERWGNESEGSSREERPSSELAEDGSRDNFSVSSESDGSQYRAKVDRGNGGDKVDPPNDGRDSQHRDPSSNENKNGHTKEDGSVKAEGSSLGEDGSSNAGGGDKASETQDGEARKERGGAVEGETRKNPISQKTAVRNILKARGVGGEDMPDRLQPVNPNGSEEGGHAIARVGPLSVQGKSREEGALISKKDLEQIRKNGDQLYLMAQEMEKMKGGLKRAPRSDEKDDEYKRIVDDLRQKLEALKMRKTHLQERNTRLHKCLKEKQQNTNSKAEKVDTTEGSGKVPLTRTPSGSNMQAVTAESLGGSTPAKQPRSNNNMLTKKINASGNAMGSAVGGNSNGVALTSGTSTSQIPAQTKVATGGSSNGAKFCPNPQGGSQLVLPVAKRTPSGSLATPPASAGTGMEPPYNTIIRPPASGGQPQNDKAAMPMNTMKIQQMTASGIPMPVAPSTSAGIPIQQRTVQSQPQQQQLGVQQQQLNSQPRNSIQMPMLNNAQLSRGQLGNTHPSNPPLNAAHHSWQCAPYTANLINSSLIPAGHNTAVQTMNAQPGHNAGVQHSHNAGVQQISPQVQQMAQMAVPQQMIDPMTVRATENVSPPNQMQVNSVQSMPMGVGVSHVDQSQQPMAVQQQIVHQQMAMANHMMSQTGINQMHHYPVQGAQQQPTSADLFAASPPNNIPPRSNT